MAYKSKEKYLERDGKTFSYCHIDPQEGKICSAHITHIPLASFTKSLMVAGDLSIDEIDSADVVAFDSYSNHNIEEAEPLPLTHEQEAELKASRDNYSKYFNMASQSLDTIAEIIIKNSANAYTKLMKIEDFFGRDGSERVEKKIVKPLLKKPEVLQEIKDNLAKNGFILDRIEDVEDSAITDPTLIESNKRAWVDVVLYGKNDEGEDVVIPVNIKSTAGKTADNVGGWRALSHVLVNKPIKRETELMEYVADNGLTETSQAQDYFLWTFYKTSNEPLGSHVTSSLLSMKPESLSINLKQSMPLQLDARKVKRHTDPLSMYERRVLLLDYIVKKTLDTTKKKVNLLERVQNRIGKA